MTHQHENLSAFMDGEMSDSGIIDAVKNDEAMQEKWRRYHLIRSGLRKEASVAPALDLTAQIAAQIEQEPTVMAPKRTWADLPVIGNVIPFAKQTGQFAVAASVAAAVILGYQQMNYSPTEPFMTAPTTGSIGGLAPVSLEQSRTIPRDDMAALMKKHRQVNALLEDHQQQIKLKQSDIEEQTDSKEKTPEQR